MFELFLKMWFDRKKQDVQPHIIDEDLVQSYHDQIDEEIIFDLVDDSKGITTEDNA